MTDFTTTKHDYFAMCVSVEDLAVPQTAIEAADFLGINAQDYNALIHWPLILAKLRYAFADAMVAESETRQ